MKVGTTYRGGAGRFVASTYVGKVATPIRGVARELCDAVICNKRSNRVVQLHLRMHGATNTYLT